MFSPSTTLPIQLQAWHDALDRGLSSVAFDNAKNILAIGSAEDVRNLLAIGMKNSRGWQSVMASSVNLTTHLTKLDRTGHFWTVAEKFKDAQRTHRAHLKLHVYHVRPVDRARWFTTDSNLLAGSANNTYLKFIILRNIVSIVLILPHGISRPSPPPLTIHRSQGLDTIILSACTICQSYDALYPPNKPTHSQWIQYVAHGLAQQIRWDFGITDSPHELDQFVTMPIVSEMERDERAGRIGSGRRYAVRPNVMQELRQFMDSALTVTMGYLDESELTEEQAEVILTCARKIGAVTMGIPGLSSAHAMIRKAPIDEPELDMILSAANILQSIRQHQDGGLVRRPLWCQLLAIGWIIASVALSIAVGAANWGNRSNLFERLTDTASTATLLLVSVFGLIKLASEDDNAIRNTLFGYKILRDVREVKRYFQRRAGGVSFGLALVAANQPLHWLAEGNTCYLQHPGLGSIVFTDGVSSDEMVALGMLFGAKVMLDYRLGRAMWNTSDATDSRVHMERKLILTDFRSKLEVRLHNYIVAGRAEGM